MKRQCGIIIASALLFSLATVAPAVEDGQGTNVVRNLRVSHGGAIDLGGDVVTNWNDLSDYVGDMGEETAARIGADAALSNAVSNLQSADTTLQNNINAASNALHTVDTTLEGEIESETSAREAADTALQSNITAASNALNTAVNNETAARTGADAALSNNVSALNTATNSLNAGIGNLQTGKFDKVGGAISGSVVYTPSSVAISAADSQISSGCAVVIITNSAGSAITLAGNSGTPISVGSAGQFITVQCTSAQPIVLTNSAGLALENGVSFTMKENDVIQLLCDGTKWTEIHRADN